MADKPTPPPATSLDKAASYNWRFSETNGFVIKDYTGLNEGEEPVIVVIKSADIFDFVADAAQEKKKVAVYAIGPCVLDWS